MIGEIGIPLQSMGTNLIQLYLVVAALFWVLTIPGLWKTFEKAGKPGWGALVPFYNAYLFFEIAGRSGWTAVVLIVPLINVIMVLTAAVEVAQAFGKGIGYALGLVVLSPVFFGLLGLGSAEYQGSPRAA